MQTDWNAALEAVADAVLLIDETWCVQRHNRAAAALLGAEEAPLTGRRYADLLHGAPRPPVDCPVARTYHTRRRERAEIELGGRRLEVTAHPILDSEGVWAGSVCVVVERNADGVGAFPPQVEFNFRDVFESANVGMALTFPSGEFELNPALARLLGYDPGGAPPQTWREVTHPGDIDTCENLVEQLLAGERSEARLVKRYVHRDGSVIWADVSSALRADKGGQPLYFISTIVDITERKQAEQALARSEEQYRALFENMNAGFILFEAVYDDAGVTTDLIVLAANEAFSETTEQPLDQVPGRRLTELLPGVDRDSANWVQLYGDVARTGRPRQFEAPSDTLGRHFSVNAYQAGPGLCAVTFQDITERVKMQAEKADLEQQLRQAQKLESVGVLAGGVAHDFNNMLSVILGFSEIVLSALPKDSPLRVEMGQIIKAGVKSGDLTRQLLAFSRTQTLQPEVVDLNATLTDLERMLTPIIGEDIQLVIERLPTAGRVLVDPMQFQQIVVNLAANARDAMPNGGRLVIEVGDVHLDETYVATHPGVAPGRYTALTVTDTGTGIPKELLGRVFDPFFTTKMRGQGTGLGLATTYGIVKQSGGSISVDSEPDQGTVFEIYLPVTEARPAPARPSAPAGVAHGDGEQVLVVEDDAGVRHLIGSALPRIGYTALVAANGDEALRMIEQEGASPDLVLTDMVMPQVNGVDLIARLRRSAPSLKYLFMSGFTDHSIVRNGTLEPGTPFIQKPFTVTRLAEKIGEVLGRD